MFQLEGFHQGPLSATLYFKPAEYCLFGYIWFLKEEGFFLYPECFNLRVFIKDHWVLLFILNRLNIVSLDMYLVSERRRLQYFQNLLHAYFSKCFLMGLVFKGRSCTFYHWEFILETSSKLAFILIFVDRVLSVDKLVVWKPSMETESLKLKWIYVVFKNS